MSTTIQQHIFKRILGNEISVALNHCRNIPNVSFPIRFYISGISVAKTEERYKYKTPQTAFQLNYYWKCNLCIPVTENFSKAVRTERALMLFRYPREHWEMKSIVYSVYLSITVRFFTLLYEVAPKTQSKLVIF